MPDYFWSGDHEVSFNSKNYLGGDSHEKNFNLKYFSPNSKYFTYIRWACVFMCTIYIYIKTDNHFLN